MRFLLIETALKDAVLTTNKFIMQQYINRMTVSYSDAPSCTEVVAITIPVEYPITLSSLRKAFEDRNRVVENEIKQSVRPSMYDCTGDSFTLNLGQISRELNRTQHDKQDLVTIYIHEIGIDV
jgi:hypothetical protein